MSSPAASWLAPGPSRLLSLASDISLRSRTTVAEACNDAGYYYQEDRPYSIVARSRRMSSDVERHRRTYNVLFGAPATTSVVCLRGLDIVMKVSGTPSMSYRIHRIIDESVGTQSMLLSRKWGTTLLLRMPSKPLATTCFRVFVVFVFVCFGAFRVFSGEKSDVEAAE